MNAAKPNEEERLAIDSALGKLVAEGQARPHVKGAVLATSNGQPTYSKRHLLLSPLAFFPAAICFFPFCMLFRNASAGLVRAR